MSKPRNPLLDYDLHEVEYSYKWAAEMSSCSTLDEVMSLMGKSEFKADLIKSDENDDYKAVNEKLLSLNDDIDDVLIAMIERDLLLLVYKMMDFLIKRNIREELILVRIFLISYGNFFDKVSRDDFLRKIQPGIDGASSEDIEEIEQAGQARYDDLFEGEDEST